MRYIVNKVLLSITLLPLVILPALSDTSQITMTATVEDFVSLQIINTENSYIVSSDNGISGPSYEVLNFGSVDARGLNSGTLTANNPLSISGLTLKKVVLDPYHNVYSQESPPGSVSGAIYYVDGNNSGKGLSILSNRSPGENGILTTSISVSSTGGIRPLIYNETVLKTALASTYGSASVPPEAIQSRPTGTAVVLSGAQPNNVPLPVIIGLFIENTTEVKTQSSTLTFTGT
jgi:hypothetical protein